MDLVCSVLCFVVVIFSVSLCAPTWHIYPNSSWLLHKHWSNLPRSINMTSHNASRRFKSPATGLCSIDCSANNLKFCITCPFWGKSAGAQWAPFTRASNAESTPCHDVIKTSEATTMGWVNIMICDGTMRLPCTISRTPFSAYRKTRLSWRHRLKAMHC